MVKRSKRIIAGTIVALTLFTGTAVATAPAADASVPMKCFPTIRGYIVCYPIWVGGGGFGGGGGGGW